MSLFTPHLHYDALHEVPLGLVWSRGVRGLLLDIDNSLAHHDLYDITPETLAWIADACAVGFRFGLYSNAVQPRIRKMAGLLGFPETPRAYKPLNIGLGGATKALGLPPHELALCGDQLFTDILAAKWGGMTAILIEPLSRREWAHTRGFRRLEYVFGRRGVGLMPTLYGPLEP